jgi:hypothetical protein
MSDDNQLEFQHLVWHRKIPETVLDVYCSYVRVLPHWRQSFPAYVHPAIRDAIELAHNRTKIITATGEYVFVLDERTTFVPEAGDYVRTGILLLYHNQTLVLRLSISAPDSSERGKNWVARGVEEFNDGDWVAEITQLLPQLAAYEAEQEKKYKTFPPDGLKALDELKGKFCKLPPMKAENRSWLGRLMRRSGT